MLCEHGTAVKTVCIKAKGKTVHQSQKKAQLSNEHVPSSLQPWEHGTYLDPLSFILLPLLSSMVNTGLTLKPEFIATSFYLAFTTSCIHLQSCSCASVDRGSALVQLPPLLSHPLASLAAALHQSHPSTPERRPHPHSRKKVMLCFKTPSCIHLHLQFKTACV